MQLSFQQVSWSDTIRNAVEAVEQSPGGRPDISFPERPGIVQQNAGEVNDSIEEPSGAADGPIAQAAVAGPGS